MKTLYLLLIVLVFSSCYKDCFRCNFPNKDIYIKNVSTGNKLSFYYYVSRELDTINFKDTLAKYSAMGYQYDTTYNIGSSFDNCLKQDYLIPKVEAIGGNCYWFR
jgi:hypothetical protein